MSNPLDKTQITKALKALLASEYNAEASEGLAASIAKSLLEEVRAGGPGCLQNLPALKQAILDYALEQVNA